MTKTFQRTNPYLEHIRPHSTLESVSGLIHFDSLRTTKEPKPFNAYLNDSFIYQELVERAYLIPEPYRPMLDIDFKFVSSVTVRQDLKEIQYDKKDKAFIESTFMYRELEKSIAPGETFEVVYYWEKQRRYFKSEDISFLHAEDGSSFVMRMEDVEEYNRTEPYRMLVLINGREEFFE